MADYTNYVPPEASNVVMFWTVVVHKFLNWLRGEDD